MNKPLEQMTVEELRSLIVWDSDQEDYGIEQVFDELARRLAELERRLEIDPRAPAYDGIACRDATIDLLEKQIERMKPVVEAAFAWLRSEPECSMQLVNALQKYKEGK